VDGLAAGLLAEEGITPMMKECSPRRSGIGDDDPTARPGTFVPETEAEPAATLREVHPDLVPARPKPDGRGHFVQVIVVVMSNWLPM